MAIGLTGALMTRSRRRSSNPYSASKVGGGLTDLSNLGWGRVVAVSVAGTLICVAAALFVDSFNFSNLNQAALVRAVTVDVLLPLCLAAPMLTFLMSKLRELAIAKYELTVLASTDSLTAVLNRGAFQLIVDGYLEKVQLLERPAEGTLLVVDVDHFKKINDDLGHHQGDAALRLIAGAIRGAVREVDLVGRIGGEEFGVFLPSLGRDEAGAIAERIRTAIGSVDFLPGSNRQLSVSVGGASFTTYVPFEALFRAADEHLYKAKRAGRNRVEMHTLAA